MVYIPTKNTYINLYEHDNDYADEEEEVHMEKNQEQRHQNVTSKSNVNKVHTRQNIEENRHINRDERGEHQRGPAHVNRTSHSSDQQQAGNDPSSSIPTNLNTVNITAGVVVGGEVGDCQGINRSKDARLDKGKGKVDEQGFLIREEAEPPDKTNMAISKNNKQKSVVIDTGQKPNDEHFDEYGVQHSEDEYDLDTQSLEEGVGPGEEISSKLYQNDPLLPSTNVEDVREVTGNQGLSPRGRKTTKQINSSSISKPNTRARSKGV